MGRGSLRGRHVDTGEPLSVRFDGGTIVSVETAIEDGSALPWIAPGLVDLQVNGFAGIDLNGPKASSEEVARLTRALLRVGVTKLSANCRHRNAGGDRGAPDRSFGLNSGG